MDNNISSKQIHYATFFNDSIKERLYKRIGVCFNPYGVPFALGKYLESRSNIAIIDIGAHQGHFTAAIDKLCGIRQGVLVEPQPARAAQLRQEFQPPRFQVVQAAVSDHASQLELEINGFDETTSILKTKRDLRELSALDVSVVERVQCPAITLDAVYHGSSLTNVELIKMDMQGAEHLAIRGGSTALARTEMVWAEVSFKELYEEACTHVEVFDLLRKCGFVLFELEPAFRGPTGELLQADALFVRQ